jgi:hypothetical protein
MKDVNQVCAVADGFGKGTMAAGLALGVGGILVGPGLLPVALAVGAGVGVASGVRRYQELQVQDAEGGEQEPSLGTCHSCGSRVEPQLTCPVCGWAGVIW